MEGYGSEIMIEMSSVNDPKVAGIPVACTLSPHDGGTRMRRWKALSEESHPTVRRQRHLLEVRYEAKFGLRQELEALADEERLCCSFMTWTVGQDGDPHRPTRPSRPGRSRRRRPIATLFGAD